MDWKKINYWLAGLLVLMVGLIGYLWLVSDKGTGSRRGEVKIEVISEVEGIGFQVDGAGMREALTDLGLWPLRGRWVKTVVEGKPRKQPLTAK